MPGNVELDYIDSPSSSPLRTIIIIAIIIMPMNESAEGPAIFPRVTHVDDMDTRIALGIAMFDDILNLGDVNHMMMNVCDFEVTFVCESLARPFCTTPRALECLEPP